MKSWMVVASLFFPMVLQGCGDSLSGIWSGTWSGGGVSGTMTLELDQDGDTVSGTATFDGSPCWSVAMLDLVTADDRLSGTASAGDLSATLNATTTDDTMSGDFTVATGACSGAGTFTAQRE